MHRAGGRSLLGHVLTAASQSEPAKVVVVSGPEMKQVEEEAVRIVPHAETAIQAERNGTGHAVMMAKPQLADFKGTVVVLYGDVPLIKPQSIRALTQLVKGPVAMAVLAFEAADPKGYGRLIRDKKGHVIAIREELDASPEERRITLCNSGIMAVSSEILWPLLSKVSNANKKGEYYLTDLVEIAASGGQAVTMFVCPESEVMGVNDRAQLAEVERHLQQDYRRKAMAGGATLVAPETVFLSEDTKIGQDVVIEPYVVIGPGVEIGSDVTVLSFSHLEGAKIANGARIGPFARLRPGADIQEDVHVGNFVEVKKAKLEKGAKVNHLSYIGDARVGARSNVGAGTITCNYDGFEKHLTDIGTDVFVGSNTALVAPVKVGDGANIGAGSVITKDVPPEALALTRPTLDLREGWAAKYREMKRKRKMSRG
jgi:bifunctional UDP-N-acetylglucosamine pyrophosphorylase/glucosamine-1-phosphate N-acetyltransferase